MTVICFARSFARFTQQMSSYGSEQLTGNTTRNNSSNKDILFVYLVFISKSVQLTIRAKKFLIKHIKHGEYDKYVEVDTITSKNKQTVKT